MTAALNRPTITSGATTPRSVRASSDATNAATSYACLNFRFLKRPLYALKERRLRRQLHPDCFDNPDVFSGEGELFSLKIVFHMLRILGAGQGKHPDLHREPKDNLRETGP